MKTERHAGSMRLGLGALVGPLLIAAGCLGAVPPAGEAAPEAPLAEAARTHVLAGALEPAEFGAPAFRLLGAVARGIPGTGGGGEPSVWAALDATLYLSFPGCEQQLNPAPSMNRCANGPVYRSDDDGETWTRLNGAGGFLDPDGVRANGDAEVTVDAAGTLYASNLGSGIQVVRSFDRGATWKYLGNLTPEKHWADRQWMAAAGPGNVIVAWMGGNGSSSQQRAVAVRSTFDSGDSWTPVAYLGQRIGWLGTVAFDPGGVSAYIPFTESRRPASNAPPQSGEFELMVARTLDGGRAWEILATGVRVATSASGGHWSGVLMAPALDVTGDGTVVFAWSEDLLAAGGVTSQGARVRFIASQDGGGSWSEPVAISERVSAIMPWVTGGAGDRFAVNYYASDVALDTDYAGRWDVMAALVDGAGSMEPRIATTRVEADVHFGGLCSRGTGCTPPSDRALLDFFESDVLPDGRFVVAYAADPHTQGKVREIRVAIQSGGPGLLVAPATSSGAP